MATRLKSESGKDAAAGSTLPLMASRGASWEPFPAIDFRQIQRLTDDTGILQHAIYNIPDPNHGYCIDDNARALIAGLMIARHCDCDESTVPIHRYLSFLTYAFNSVEGRFRNFMAYDRRWLEDEGSPDSQGRAIWALGCAVRLAPNEMVGQLAHEFMDRALPCIESLGHIRSWAFALIGLDEYLKAAPEREHARTLRDRYAVELYQRWCAHATRDWPWWEDIVTYDNAKLCHAMLVCGHAMGRADMQRAAIRSLTWLIDEQTADDGHLSIIGNEGWLRKPATPRTRGTRATFDQQPLEAHAMVHACIATARITGDTRWADAAWRCFEWFLGKNDANLPLYDDETGGCRDGLHPDGTNSNQGAESSLAYLLSVLELHRWRAVVAG